MGRWTKVEKGGADNFGKGQVSIQHNLNDSGLFTDDALAELIDRYPREFYMLNTMTKVGEEKVWRSGDKGNLSGKEIIKAIHDGQVWMCLRRFDVVAPAYHKLIDDSFEELEEGNPELKTFKRESSLLISSPTARVFYHTDIPFICLWHLRGKKRVWLYDAENKTHLPDETLEGVILRETEEEVAYDAEWDKNAQSVLLEPGQALSWELNAPHRVDNVEGLNVSITTEFFTPEAQRKYGVYYTNGYMRRYMGMQPKSTDINGLGAYAKCAAALGIKKLGLLKGKERKMMCSFTMDKNDLTKIVDIPANEQWEIKQA